MKKSASDSRASWMRPNGLTLPAVRVEEGVVFLNGRVASDELKKWAGDLARNTQDVVAVANRMDVTEPSFRDITENFLASIFLSVQRPFETGDLVEVSGVTGYIQQLNVRTTILMTLDGNIVQVPNASVYKSNLRNFTASSNRRDHFDVGIGYDDTIDDAQEIALQVLTDHPAVLCQPEPSVLVESLGKATVNLRVYFWINGRNHSWLKVRSSVIRLVNRAFQNHGISMPDEAREVVFPQGIPVTMLEGKPVGTPDARAGKPFSADGSPQEPDVVST